jgi:hypothetical protein
MFRFGPKVNAFSIGSKPPKKSPRGFQHTPFPRGDFPKPNFASSFGSVSIKDIQPVRSIKGASMYQQNQWANMPLSYKIVSRFKLPDRDRDGVPDRFDCQPMNPKKDSRFTVQKRTPYGTSYFNPEGTEIFIANVKKPYNPEGFKLDKSYMIKPWVKKDDVAYILEDLSPELTRNKKVVITTLQDYHLQSANQNLKSTRNEFNEIEEMKKADPDRGYRKVDVKKTKNRLQESIKYDTHYDYVWSNTRGRASTSLSEKKPDIVYIFPESIHDNKFNELRDVVVHEIGHHEDTHKSDYPSLKQSPFYISDEKYTSGKERMELSTAPTLYGTKNSGEDIAETFAVQQGVVSQKKIRDKFGPGTPEFKNRVDWLKSKGYVTERYPTVRETIFLNPEEAIIGATTEDRKNQILLEKGVIDVEESPIQRNLEPSSVEKQEEWKEMSESEKITERIDKPDTDGDGTPDKFDCEPENPEKQEIKTIRQGKYAYLVDDEQENKKLARVKLNFDSQQAINISDWKAMKKGHGYGKQLIQNLVEERPELQMIVSDGFSRAGEHNIKKALPGYVVSVRPRHGMVVRQEFVDARIEEQEKPNAVRQFIQFDPNLHSRNKEPASVEKQQEYKEMSDIEKTEVNTVLPDTDKDGVPNEYDCEPLNPDKQDVALPAGFPGGQSIAPKPVVVAQPKPVQIQQSKPIQQSVQQKIQLPVAIAKGAQSYAGADGKPTYRMPSGEVTTHYGRALTSSAVPLIPVTVNTAKDIQNYWKQNYQDVLRKQAIPLEEKNIDYREAKEQGFKNPWINQPSGYAGIRYIESGPQKGQTYYGITVEPTKHKAEIVAHEYGHSQNNPELRDVMEQKIFPNTQVLTTIKGTDFDALSKANSAKLETSLFKQMIDRKDVSDLEFFQRFPIVKDVEKNTTTAYLRPEMEKAYKSYPKFWEFTGMYNKGDYINEAIAEQYRQFYKNPTQYTKEYPQEARLIAKDIGLNPNSPFFQKINLGKGYTGEW